MRSRRTCRFGFTLIELLLVLTIVGLMAAVIIPRAMRANNDSKFNIVRQYGSEIASYIMTWATDQTRAQRPETSFTVKDFLNDDIVENDGAGLTSNKLVGKYIGNKDYDPVESVVPSGQMPRNPFNEASYFAAENDDTAVPSKKPGLLYLAARPDPRETDFLNFFLVYTSNDPDATGNYWHAGMDPEDGDKLRRGIFVARLFDDLEYGGAGPTLLMGQPPSRDYLMGGATAPAPGQDAPLPPTN